MPGRFSFNVKGGRCEACQGEGIIQIEMNFLPDVFVPCEVCHGRRYNREALEITYKGKSIADVLEMTVAEALDFFQNVPRIRNKLQTLNDVGLGYVHLGQPATQLSGGEAQRVKLASELSRRATGRTLYILDEPTTGLHFADIEQLLAFCSGSSTAAIRSWSSSTISTSSSPPTGSSTWARKAAMAAAGDRRGDARDGGDHPWLIHGRVLASRARRHGVGGGLSRGVRLHRMTLAPVTSP